MRNTKVRPIIIVSASRPPDTPLNESFRLLTPNAWQQPPKNSPMQDDYGRDYWYARRAFLTSYHFSERRNNNGFKEKIKRSLKGLNEVAMSVFLEVRREILSKRRLGVRVYRFTVGWPTLFMVRCFVPWPHKDQQHLDP